MHGSSTYRVPWNYGEEAKDVASFFAKTKNELMPYIYSHACRSAETGIPLMRSMILEFPEDKNVTYLDRQYMLGPDMLVAPVFDKNGDVDVYLPEGVWTDYFTNETYIGGKWYSFKNVSYMYIPCYVRENSVIPVGARNDRPDYDYMDGLRLKVYQPEPDMKKEVIIYDCDGEGKHVVNVGVKDGIAYGNDKEMTTIYNKMY